MEVAIEETQAWVRAGEGWGGSDLGVGMSVVGRVVGFGGNEPVFHYFGVAEDFVEYFRVIFPSCSEDETGGFDCGDLVCHYGCF